MDPTALEQARAKFCCCAEVQVPEFLVPHLVGQERTVLPQKRVHLDTEGALENRLHI